MAHTPLTMTNPTSFQVTDRVGTVVSTVKTRKAANASADRRNAAHGSYRYSVKAVYA